MAQHRHADASRPRRTPLQIARFRDQLEPGSDHNVIDSHPNASSSLVRFWRSCMSSYGLNRLRLVNPARCGERHRGRPASTARKLRPGPEAADSLVNPACSLARGPFGTIDAAHRQLPPWHSPPSIAAISSPLRHLRLDPGAGPASTTVSRWPSWPCSSRSQRRRSRYLPFKPRSRTGTAAAPRGGGPEVFFVVHVPVALLAFVAGRS